MTVIADGLLLDGEALRLRESEARIGRRVLCHREVASTSAVAAVILGVGLNVNQEPAHFPPDLGGRAGSVAMAAGRALPRADLFRALLRRLDDRYREFLRAGPGPALAEAGARSLTLGQAVRAREGEAELTGVAVLLEADGALALQLQDGKFRRLVAGEVTLLQEP